MKGACWWFCAVCACGEQDFKHDTQHERVLLLQCAAQPGHVVKGFPRALTASWAGDAVGDESDLGLKLRGGTRKLPQHMRAWPDTIAGFEAFVSDLLLPHDDVDACVIENTIAPFIELRGHGGIIVASLENLNAIAETPGAYRPVRRHAQLAAHAMVQGD